MLPLTPYPVPGLSSLSPTYNKAMSTSGLTALPEYLSPESRARLGRLDTAAARTQQVSHALAEADYSDELSLAMLRDAEIAHDHALEQLYSALGEEASRSVEHDPSLANLPFAKKFEIALARTFEIAKGLPFARAEDQFLKPAHAESVPPGSPVRTGICAQLVSPPRDSAPAR